MKHLPESLGALGVEGRVNGAWPGGAPAQRRLKTAVVEDVDGVAGGLRVALEAAGDLVGVLAPVAGEKYLATSEDESTSEERKPASRDSRSASESGRTKIGRLMSWRITHQLPPHLNMH